MQKSNLKTTKGGSSMVNELLVRLTYRCNRKCKFCFNYIFDDKVNYDSNESMDVEALIQFIQKHEIRKVHLSGGEPTMYRDIVPLIKRLSEIAKVSYFTNGMLFSRFNSQEIANMGIHRIKVSLYNEEILDESIQYQNMYKRIGEIKKKNPYIKFKAAFMIDTDFFDVIQSKHYRQALEVFDSIKWQPLTVGNDHPLYATTIEGMEPKVRDEIFRILSTFPDNKVEAYEAVLNNQPLDTCYMGRNYLTMNPDMSISLCPHLNGETLSIEEYEKEVKKCRIFFENPTCRTMRCISLQAFLEKKYGGK